MPVGKVLVVDDARAIVEAMTKALQRLGVPPKDILSASRSADAIKLFQQHAPSAVFIDMDLAGEPGDETAIRIMEESPSTKVIVVTGMNPDQPRVRAVVSAGAYAVVEKPVRLARLQEVLGLIESEDKGLRRVM